ncbi:PLP-dependent aspartate aminotransferase family protein [Dongia sp.]|uniref:trans-sulfuration enzyme family protein n=1 Tax=Dongia sp. TaxID=1977262 RepID=UPI0035AE552F
MDDESICVTPSSVSLGGFASLGPATYRASTIVFENSESYRTRLDRGDDGYVYGLYGTPTTRFLEKQIAALERASRTFLVPSGQAANTLAMLAVLEPGNSVLISDSVYPPVRDFANNELKKLGVRVAFYPPTDLAALKTAMDSTTRLIWVESPGSTTMEVQDVRSIVALAHECGAVVGCDNTWATPFLFKPLEFGVDISVQALSKYANGHSDVLMGSISVRDPVLAAKIKGTIWRLGIGVSPDDCALVQRGLQTMSIRLTHSGAVATRMATWIATQPAVACVLHPALPGNPGHAFWARDFNGASGVFSVGLKNEVLPRLDDAFDSMRIFSIGASWGGTRSLIVPMNVNRLRSTPQSGEIETYLRISVGLESERELMADIRELFAKLQPPAPDAVSA